MNSNDQLSRLPESIKIDDITTGKIDPNLIYDEIDRLKAEINILKNDMSLFLKALATIPPNQSQQEYYRIVMLRLKTVQTSIKEYCDKYNKLLPIINLAQIKLGHDVEAPPPPAPPSTKPSRATLTVNNTNNTTPVMNNKTTPTMPNGNPAPAMVSNGNGTAGGPISNGTTSAAARKRANSVKKTSNNKNVGNSSNQPIVI